MKSESVQECLDLLRMSHRYVKNDVLYVAIEEFLLKVDETAHTDKVKQEDSH